MNYKRTIQYCFLSALLIFLVACEPDEKKKPVEDISLEISLDSMLHHVEVLSGERTFRYQGKDILITSRCRDSIGNKHAELYLEKTLKRYGLEVEKHVFSPTGTNIFGLQHGHEDPGNYYMISAHFDSKTYDSIAAPGADDNASGVATVLETARLLSNYPLDYSVKYAFWDEEENGLVGSKAYAKKIVEQSDGFEGLLNVDMIAWDGNDDKLLLVAIDSASRKSMGMYAVLSRVHDRFALGLQLDQVFKEVGSDQTSFWRHDLPAIGLHEDVYGDKNKHYHRHTDKIEYYSLPYFNQCATLAILSFAEMNLVKIE
jgi:hypothetical protein